MSVYLSDCLSVYLSDCLSVYPSIFLTAYPSICLSVCLSIYLSIYLSSWLPIYLTAYPSICLFMYVLKFLDLKIHVLPSMYCILNRCELSLTNPIPAILLPVIDSVLDASLRKYKFVLDKFKNAYHVLYLLLCSLAFSNI